MTALFVKKIQINCLILEAKIATISKYRYAEISTPGQKLRYHTSSITIGAFPDWFFFTPIINSSRSHLKNKILVHIRGGAEFQTDGAAVTATAGILKYFEDLKRGTNPASGGRPKDIFKIASRLNVCGGSNYKVDLSDLIN